MTTARTDAALLTAFAAALLRPGPAARVRFAAGEADGWFTIVRTADGAAAGRIEVEAQAGVLFVRALVVAPELRGYGLGSEAARLVREAAEAAGCAGLRAWAPPDLGLAVYFWSRMGLRPLHGPGPDGGIGMERRLR